MDRRALYKEFLSQFPIERLADLTLEEYTNLDKENSFCYWLESKTYELGSIWGGSAYKFGIFKFDKTPKQDNSKYAHDENYSWSSRLGATSEEAFNNVKNAIIRIANHARKNDWQEIENINELWPVTTWKIAFLYSNEQLLPFYDKDGWLVPLATHLGLSNAKKCSRAELYHFLLSKKGNKDLYEYSDELLAIGETEQSKKKNRVWLFAPGENAFMWDECKATQTMRLGWDSIGDLSGFKNSEELTKALQSAYGKEDSSFRNDSLALWQFQHEIRQGDIVYAKKGINKIIGRGVVEGDCYYDELLSTYRHLRSVKWTHTGEWDYSQHKLPLKTLTDISGQSLAKTLNDMVVEEKSIETIQPVSSKKYWWLVAAPDVWNFSDISVGETMEYTLLNENGNKRRVYQNFLDAKAGDLVIGYASTPTLQIVALGEIAKDTDDKHLYFKKTEQLLAPIDYSVIKGYEELQGMECMAGGGRGTLFKVTEEEYQVLMEIIRNENPLSSTDTVDIYTDAQFLNEVYMSSPDLQKLKALIKNKKNLILQGAPGVGKTFTAERLAFTLMGCIDKQRVEMVQFHQNYSYEDFILGYKPNAEGGFELRHGIFYKFCKKALNTPDKDFFFIIDEINRGNLSKIFGELLMLIENSYRGKEIKLAYTDELFTVPKNLHIIGMMNTADRSLAMIDYALRRRFSFFEMYPGFATDGFKNYQTSLANEKLDKVIQGIQALNDVICKDDSLGHGFCIGHSYFCNQTEFTQEWLENVIEYDIQPMLKEYWFDDIQKYESHINHLRALLK